MTGGDLGLEPRPFSRDLRLTSGRDSASMRALFLPDHEPIGATAFVPRVAEVWGRGIVPMHSDDVRVDWVECDVVRRNRSRPNGGQPGLGRLLGWLVIAAWMSIAPPAQAGRVVAVTRLEAAVEALAALEEEATRALEEMRSMIPERPRRRARVRKLPKEAQEL